VFISIIAFYLGCPFRVVVLPFAIHSRKFRTKFQKNFKTTEFFNLPFAKGLPPSRKAPAGQDSEMGRGLFGFWEVPTNRNDASFVIMSVTDYDCAIKNYTASEVAGRRVSNL
jgi:hypothetical protein